jgi:hypothetical protein
MRDPKSLLDDCRILHFPAGKLAGPVPRSPSRPERHFFDSFITLRLALARAIATWLPRCPTCHRPACPTLARSPVLTQ